MVLLEVILIWEITHRLLVLATQMLKLPVAYQEQIQEVTTPTDVEHCSKSIMISTVHTQCTGAAKSLGHRTASHLMIY